MSPLSCPVILHLASTLISSFSVRISKEENEAYVASLDQEEAELEKALASSAEEHARLVAAKQSQELMLVEHLSALNITPGSRGEGDVVAMIAFIIAALRGSFKVQSHSW